MKKEKILDETKVKQEVKPVKKESKNIKLVDKKKTISKNTKPKKKEKDKNKVGIFKRMKNFFEAVIKEVKHVSWPTKKDMINYSVATVVFILFFGIFFYIIELVMAFLRTLV